MKLVDLSPGATTACPSPIIDTNFKVVAAGFPGVITTGIEEESSCCLVQETSWDFLHVTNISEDL